MPQREAKEPVRKMSYYMNLKLFDRLRQASFEDKLTVTDMIHNCVEAYLADRDKYYNPNDPQPEDLQREQAEADAEFEAWTPSAPVPKPEKAEIEYSEDPPPGYENDPDSSAQADQPDIF